MEKKLLKLGQFFNLDAELNGFVNPETKEKVLDGILSQKISIKTKYWLTNLSKKIKAEIASCDELKNDLLKKYGKEENGNISIKYMDKNEDGSSSVNENFLKFQEEYNSLMNEEKEIEFKELTIEDIGNIETTDVYETLFSMLKFE